jgi:hypothetical protein
MVGGVVLLPDQPGEEMGVDQGDAGLARRMPGVGQVMGEVSRVHVSE